MGPPRGRTLHVFGLFRVRPFKEGTRKRLEYITQNEIMSMASHGLSQFTCIKQLTLGPCVVQISLRGGHVPFRIDGNETLVFSRVVW